MVCISFISQGFATFKCLHCDYVYSSNSFFDSLFYYYIKDSLKDDIAISYCPKCHLNNRGEFDSNWNRQLTLF